MLINELKNLVEFRCCQRLVPESSVRDPFLPQPHSSEVIPVGDEWERNKWYSASDEKVKEDEKVQDQCSVRVANGN